MPPSGWAAEHRTYGGVVLEGRLALAGRPRAAAELPRLVARLCALGTHVGIVAPGGLDELDATLLTCAEGPGRILLAPHDGSALYAVEADGPRLVRRRAPQESCGRPLDRAVLRLQRSLAARGLATHLVTAEPDLRRIALESRLASADVGSLDEVVQEAARIACDEGLVGARITTHVGHLDVALGPGFHARRLLLDAFEALGVGPGLVLIARENAVAALRDQLQRHRLRRAPAIDLDPRWVVSSEGPDRVQHRVEETLYTLVTGGVGTRGALEEPSAFGSPLVVAAGVYAGTGAETTLLAGPPWHTLPLDEPPVSHRRHLDLRTGILLREEVGGGALRSARFASAARPGVVTQRTEGADAALAREPSGRRWSLVSDVTGSGLGALVDQRTDEGAAASGVGTVDRIAALVADPRRSPTREQARAVLEPALALGYDGLLAEQRAAWAGRWREAGIRLPDDPERELALRFALFQLWGLADADDELAVGARGLSGTGYRGHVFWDADVFVLPALMTVAPDAATAMTRYRLRRLAAASEQAAARGHAGARFPWESAASGSDVTPASGWLGDEEVPILTGALEEHVTADVAWAVVRRATWAGDPLTAEEGALVAETARYWVSRVTLDADGSAHIRDVIGPDEYHEHVTDNAFTNVMARWNIRAALRLVPERLRPAERAAWPRLASSIVDGYRADSGLYEQFRGYFDLEPLRVEQIGTAPLAADVLAGRARIAASQVIKQPDVLMLHQLVPDEVAPASLRANLDFYEPRTAHGSSLSPASGAHLLARAGRTREALALLDVALGLDLRDRVGLSAAGLHLAAVGGVWQAVLFGFLGLDVRDGILTLDPRIPSRWREMDVRFRALGTSLRLSVRAGRGRLVAGRSLRVRGRDEELRTLLAGEVGLDLGVLPSADEGE